LQSGVGSVYLDNIGMNIDHINSIAALRGILENISDVIAIISPEGVIRFKSANIQRLFGWTAEEVTGTGALELVHPDDRPVLMEKLQYVLARPGGTMDAEGRYRHKDGRYRWVRFSAVNRTDDPVIGGVLVKYTDITAQKTLEFQNDERKRYLEGIVGCVPDAIITLDSNHNVVEWNGGAERLFGYTAREAVGRYLDDLVTGGDPEERKRAEAFTGMVMRNETLPQTEALRYRKDGTPVHVILSGAPIMEKGERIGVVASYKDITPQKKAEQRVRDLLEEKTIILREIGHRIRNDLALVGSLLAVQADESSSPEVAAALMDARGRVLVINNIYHRLDAAADVDTVELDGLLSGVIDDLRRGSVPGHITLSYGSCGTSATHVSTRLSIALGIIINELVTNAVKYAFPDDAEISRPGVDISASADSRWLSMTVRDNGVGLPETVRTGTAGFGLTVIRALVSQHDGRISLENHPEGGSLFVIGIPLGQET
jgi:PAS domain S-box-containing protein